MTEAVTGAGTRRRPGPLLAPGGGRRALFPAIAGLSLVASLLIVGAVAAGRGAEDWRGRLAGSATVVVRAAGLESPDAAAARAAEALGAVNGVARSWPLEAAAADPAIARLVDGKPGAGTGVRLVAVQFKAGSWPGPAALSRVLAADGLNVGVDDHRPWTSPVLRAAALAALTAALLLAAIVVGVGVAAAWATGKRLAAQRQLVDLLRLSGAADGFVGRLFVTRAAATAAWAGAAGALAAALIMATWRLSGESAIAGLLPSPAWADLAADAPWPLAAALVGATGAWLAVRAALKRAP